MNSNIQRLYEIAQKPSRKIIGLMAGTSLDGLDIALCTYQGSGLQTKVTVDEFETIPFSEEVKNEIRKIFAKKEIEFEQLCLLNPWIGNLHAEMINAFLQKRNIPNTEIDLIASHGQTVFHAPKIQHAKANFPNATLQIGDGDHIAVKTGIITLSDFRQKHCAAGGEGAPLAVYGDYLIFSEKNKNRILLNMGGISNFTFLSGDLDSEKVFATDTGTGNTIMDALMQREYGLPYDEDGAKASAGTVNKSLLEALKDHPFFTKELPKTTGPEVFNLAYLANAQKTSNTQSETTENILATLSLFTAETIADAIKQLPSGDHPNEVFMSGGGMHNPAIVNKLKALFPKTTFLKTDDIGINGDAKEAVLFATLANEAIVGGHTDFGKRGGVPSVTMGKISFPN
ncbi:anhydro-N-acetylmuramic acid kinase [Lacihabitans lacunae]|uniref:Anhydro-N-acetylmuramic acid kinase n=1 Tax=Lacihabitans lacunae TaxID=1028214 RepID=A0ABV7Z075_9BACT